MSKRSSISLAIAASLGVVLGCLGMPANAVLMSTLDLPGGSITCGDKVFTNFSYLATGDMPTASGVNVVCAPPNFGADIGLEFQGGFLDLPGGGSSDALIRYTITATGGFLIEDALISGNPSVVGGTGSMVVTDTLSIGPPTLNIFDIVPGSTQLTDSRNFTPVGSINVTKDILGSAGTGTATLSVVDQVYSQTTPEPASLLLVAGALLGMGVVRRRGSK